MSPSRYVCTLLVGCAYLIGCGKPEVTVLYRIGGKSDNGWNDAIYQSLVKSQQENPDLTIIEKSPKSYTEAQGMADLWMAQINTDKRQLLISGSALYGPIIEGLGCSFDQRYVLALDTHLSDCESVRSVMFNTYQSAFLAGVAAMQVSSLKKAAAIGGLNLPAVREYVDGFKAGVEYAGGTFVRTKYFTPIDDGFNNTDLAKETAEAFYSNTKQKVDVILAAAGGSNTGIFDAARTQAGRYVVSTDEDQAYLAKEVVIGSVVKLLDKYIDTELSNFAKGVFKSGTHVVGENEGTTAFVINDHFLDWVRSAVTSAQKDAYEASQGYNREDLR